MSQMRLDVVGADYDTSCINCGVGSIQDMMRNSYYMTICKQALAYNILIDNVIVGNCQINFGIFKDDDYNSGNPEFCAIDIQYIAIDRKYQNHGYGTLVLRMLIQNAFEWSTSLPIRCLTLNALPGLTELYRNNGFVEYPRVFDSRFPDCTPMMIDFMDKKLVDTYASSL